MVYIAARWCAKYRRSDETMREDQLPYVRVPGDNKTLGGQVKDRRINLRITINNIERETHY